MLNSIKQSKKQRLYISDYFRKTALKYPNKTAIVFEDRQLTFRELDELSNQIANILRGAGLRHGNTAAVFMENSLEYLPVFLAMCKLGVTGILITYSNEIEIGSVPMPMKGSGNCCTCGFDHNLSIEVSNAHNYYIILGEVFLVLE